MNKFFRALIAGYGAKKLGGGCLSTIIIFFVIYWALGTCNSQAAITNKTGNHQTTPAVNTNKNVKAFYMYVPQTNKELTGKNS